MSITKQQLLQLLRATPEGLSSNEVAEKLCEDIQYTSGRLSKMAAYGEIDKVTSPSLSGKTKWRLKQKSSHPAR